MSAPAGWYPDPSDGSRQRWWDGAQWTAHASPAAPSAPQYGYASSHSEEPKVHVDTNTVWIWLALGVSVLPLLALFLVDWDAYMRAIMRSAQDARGTAGMGEMMQWQLRSFAISAVGWVVAAAYIVLSWLDRRELGRRGIAAPFHWAWAFLGLIVYIIGRAVVLRRRTVAGGWPPLWAGIGVSVLGIIVAAIVFVSLMQAMFAGLAGVYSGS